MILIFAFLLSLQFKDDYFASAIVFCDCVIVLAILIVFAYGEYVYINGGLSSRPLRVFENGLLIPPLYLRRLRRNGGLIKIEDIEQIVAKRVNIFILPCLGPTETLVTHGEMPLWRYRKHLKNGKKGRSVQDPLETIRKLCIEYKTIGGSRLSRRFR